MRYTHCNCPQANIYTLFNNASKNKHPKILFPSLMSIRLYLLLFIQRPLTFYSRDAFSVIDKLISEGLLCDVPVGEREQSLTILLESRFRFLSEGSRQYISLMRLNKVETVCTIFYTPSNSLPKFTCHYLSSIIIEFYAICAL